MARLHRATIELPTNRKGCDMGTIPPIDRDSARAVLGRLSTVNAPLSEAAARTLAARQHWTVDAELPGEALAASGNWPAGAETIDFLFRDGDTIEITISAFAWFHDNPQAHLTALDVFAMLVREATELFGERTGEILGRDSKAWWMLPGKAIGSRRR